MHSHQSGFSVLKFLLIVLILSSFVAGFFYIKVQGHKVFPIATIKVASNYHRVSKTHLKKVIAAHIQKENFLTLNIAQLKKALLNIPWVQDATIRRVWPGTLLIKLEEQKPLALFNEKGVVNQKGDLFYPNPASIPQDLPRLVAADSEMNTALQHYQKMAMMLKPLKIEIVLLECGFDGNHKVVLNNGIILLLGKTNISGRWNRFVLSYPKLLQEANSTNRRIGQIDLRYPNGFAVRWRPNLQIQPTKPE